MNKKRINDFLWKIERLIDEIQWEVDILRENYSIPKQEVKEDG